MLVVVVVDVWWLWVVVMGDGERRGGERGLRENLNCFDYKSGHSLQRQNKGKYLPPVNALLTTTTHSIPPSSP